MSIALFDIDRFKRINDRYGHSAGDAVLRKFASFLRERTRSTDAVVRYGGEEFAVLMATADSDVALEQTDRIRAEVEKTPFILPGQAEPIEVTISGGWPPTRRTGRRSRSLPRWRMRAFTTPRRAAETGSPPRGRSNSARSRRNLLRPTGQKAISCLQFGPADMPPTRSRWLPILYFSVTVCPPQPLETVVSCNL